MKNPNEPKTQVSFEESDLNKSLSIESDSKEIESYTQICNTASSSIRWLIFAIAVCSGVITLSFVVFYFSNIEYAIIREKTVISECQEFWECLEKNSLGEQEQCLQRKKGECSNCEDKEFQKANKQKCKNCNNFENLSAGCKIATSEVATNKITTYENLRKETQIISLPLVNLKMVITDFVIAVIALGTFFWYWLWQILRFTRNLLCSLYNNNRTYFTQSTTHTISAQFLLIWTGGARRSLSNLPGYVFWSFIVIIIIVMTSDIFDSIEKYNTPGWSEFKVFIIGKLIVEGIFLGVSIYLFRMTWVLIRDIRNLLILLEWSQSSLYPLMYELFEELKDELVEKLNETSYDEDEKGEFGLRFKFLFKDSKGEESKNKIIFSAPVNLSKKAQEFSKRSHENRKALNWMFTEEEEENKRLTTFEERRMRRFFYEMLVKKEFGDELAKVFNSKVIERRGLGAELEKLQNRDKDVDLLPHASNP